ncbi:hypothetical protein CVT25_009071 [Psilocybe cyanescens]|uniref:Uncharacterized protein n=1 Tax=Psilocybe cyanescens TaxID=93625 RepID=A0A409X8I5_PSICY|nr:hypothetical protein CVT25_009071 [Psilocybe cyanescens]
MSLKKPSLRPGSAWLFTTGLGRLQALSLGRHITSLVFFQIGTQKLTIKEPAKKQAHVQILAGGLEDSDAEAVNPFPLLSKLGPHTLTEEELTKRSQQARQNPSHQNKAKNGHAPHPGVRKTVVKIPPPIRVKAERHTEEPMPVKSRKHKNDSVAAKIQSNSIPVEIAVATQTKPKHLNGNNVQIRPHRWVLRLDTKIQHVNLRAGSASDNGYPKGFVALIMAAVSTAKVMISLQL